MRNKIFRWAIRLGIFAIIGFVLFCLGRGFNHFPKHEKEVSVSIPANPVQSVSVPVYEAV